MKKTRIGAIERVSIPEWGLRSIRAKIDTGAFTSSIDVESVKVAVEDGTGRDQAVITLLHRRRHQTIRAPVAAYRRVRNPSGGVTTRPIVEVVIVLGGRRFRTPVNLHRREGMSFRMIIGRRALAGRFVVDVALGRKKTAEKTIPQV